MKLINALIFMIGLILVVVPGIWYRQPMGIVVGILCIIASGLIFFSKKEKT